MRLGGAFVDFDDDMLTNGSSVFLAIKYASAAMGKLCSEKGKTVPGGSLILTASGMVLDDSSLSAQSVNSCRSEG